MHRLESLHYMYRCVYVWLYDSVEFPPLITKNIKIDKISS